MRVLAHDEFLGGAADTGFLDRHDPAQLAAPLVAPEGLRQAAAAAALAAQAARRTAARAMPSLPSGWRNNPSGPQATAFTGPGGEELPVEYRFARDGRLATLRVQGHDLDAPRLHAASGDEVDLEIAGVRRRHRVHLGRDGAVFVNTGDGQVDLTEAPRFPDARQAAKPGSLAVPAARARDPRVRRRRARRSSWGSRSSSWRR